jgi:hypothetical protein
MERGCSSTFIISSLNSICCQVLGSVCVCVSVCMSECVCTQLLCNSMWCFALLFLCNKMIPSCFLGERREREKKSVKASQTLLKTRNAFPFIIIMLRTLYKLQIVIILIIFFPSFGELESTHTHNNNNIGLVLNSNIKIIGCVYKILHALEVLIYLFIYFFCIGSPSPPQKKVS